jgi:four helix bundle protein
MQKVRHYQDLLVWQRAMDLVVRVHEISATWPAQEQYGLISQIRRASYSVPSNIAEGKARRGEKEFLRYLLMASGSLAEVETQLLLADRIGYVKPEALAALMDDAAGVGKLLTGLITAAQRSLADSGQQPAASRRPSSQQPAASS